MIERVPPPVGDATKPLQALIFDSLFDPYRGVITYLRVQEGVLPSGARIRMFATHVESDAEETGVNAPEPTPVPELGPGEVGYLVTGLKDVHHAKVGDTITLAGKQGATEPLPGYREPKPMVWSGLFPADGSDYADLRDALDKLKLSDAALHFEPETSQALGFGFRCGFLGPAAHGHREGAPRARVRPGAHRDGAQRRVPRVPRHRDDDRAQPGRDAARAATTTGSRSPSSTPRSSRRRTTSAR